MEKRTDNEMQADFIGILECSFQCHVEVGLRDLDIYHVPPSPSSGVIFWLADPRKIRP